MYDDHSDEELVDVVLEKREVFGVLIGRYEEKLARYVRRITQIADDEVYDVLQDVFLKVYTNLRGFDKKLKFSSWIYRITHNEVISLHRKNKSRAHGNMIDIDDDVFLNIAGEDDILRDVDRELLKDYFSEIFLVMRPKYREVLVLKFMEDKNYKEISDIIKRPEGTVGTLINRAKKQFKKLYEQKRNG